MVSPVPVQAVPKEGQYVGELSSFGDLSILFRNFATKAMRASLSSPPLAKDIGELESVIDKTLLRIYFKVDGTLRYIQLT